MTDTVQTTSATRTPWHIWLVGGLALLWNGYGAYDYLMTNLQGDAYLAGMGATPAMIAYFNAMPLWMSVAWALGVWGALLGAVLLLARLKWALHAFLISLVGLLGSWVHTFTRDGLEVMGTPGLVFSLVITAVCLFLAWYAWAMTKRGVLR